MQSDNRLIKPQFPLSNKYNPDWVVANASGGANSLWLAEWLAPALDLKPGMRVLDLGCGRACSSIFLHREFGVQVWATDLWFSATENAQRIKDAGVDAHVFPIHANARELPFASEFFDAIVCIDSYMYFATDDMFLGNLARYVKPGGVIGLAGSGLMHEMDRELPEHLRAWWVPELWSLHSAGWWRRHWERTGILDVELADSLEDGWQYWLDWHREIAPDNEVEISALRADKGRTLGFVRALGRRREGVELEEPMVSMPADYSHYPVLRTYAVG